MLLYCGFIILAECFSNRNNERSMQNVDHNDSLRLKDSDNVLNFRYEQDYLLNHNVESQDSAKISSLNTNPHYPYLNKDFQQHPIIISSLNNLNSNNSYYEKFSSKDQNLNMIKNDVNFNVAGQFNENLSEFTAFKHENDDSLEHNIDKNKIRDGRDINQSYNVCSSSSISHQATKSFFGFNKRDNEGNEEISQSDSFTLARENKKLKNAKCDLQCSKNSNSSSASNVAESSEIKSFEDISEQESIDKTKNQEFDTIEKPLRRSKKVVICLGTFKSLEENFKSYEKYNKSLYAIICSELKELKWVLEYTKKICKRWNKNETLIEDSKVSREIFKQLQRLILDIRNTTIFFRKSAINQNLLTSSTEIFDQKHKKLKIKIENSKKSIEYLKQLGIEQILEENEGSDDDSNGGAGKRDITVYYQEENNLNLQYFSFPIRKEFYIGPLTVIDESIFLCIYHANQYLKILKVDLKTKEYKEIKEYVIIDEEGSIRNQYFGFGTKYSILRSGSEGKLFLLKTHLKKQHEKRSACKKYFEIIAINKKFERLACIQVDSIEHYYNSVRPAILDFIVHNGLVYALDMKIRCIKIFNESLVLLRTIAIPESLIEIEGVNLAVNSKLILIGVKKTIYYIFNNDQDTEFKSLEFNNLLLNIACCDEENIIVRSTDGFYLLFKIEQNLCEVRLIDSPSLYKLNDLILTNFTIKDSFVYCIRKRSPQIFKLSLNLDANVVAIQ